MYKRNIKEILKKEFTGSKINGINHFNWVHVSNCQGLSISEIDAMVDLLNSNYDDDLGNEWETGIAGHCENF